MNKKFTKLIAALALLAFMTPSLAGWGQTSNYVITFGTGSGDGTSASTSTACSTIVSAGSDYLSGNLVTATKVYYNGDNGLKLGTSSAAGVLKMNLSTSGQVTPTSIVVNAKLYNSSKEATLKVNGSATQNVTSDFSDLTFNITSAITYLQLESSKYIWVSSITVNYSSGGGNTPSMSVSTNSIDFGSNNTINPSEPYTETFDVTFANLTESLAITGFTGVTVSPATISSNATSPQTVTVSYNPTAAGSISGNISVNSSEVTEALVAVTGSAYDPANIDTYAPYNGVITEGDYVIYANGGAMKNELTTGSTKRIAIENITLSEGVISNPPASIIWHIAANGDYWTIYNESAQLYAAFTSTNGAATLLSSVIDNARWTITPPTSGYDYTIVNKGKTSGNNLLRRNGDYGWASYASSTGNAPTLYKKVNTNQVAMPTFTPPAGSYQQTQNVTIACETADATIQYKLTENGEWQTYSSAITINSTTTVWAKATKTGMDDSDVATATYTLPLSTMQEIFDAATSSNQTVFVTFNNWVVSGAAQTTAYVTDGEKGFVVTNYSGHGFHEGDILSGTAECTLNLYGGAARLQNLSSSTTGLTVTENGSVSLANIELTNLAPVNTGALVHYDNLTCSVNNSNYYLSDGTTTIQVYTSLYSTPNNSLADGKVYNITGVYTYYNAHEICPRSAADIVEVQVQHNEYTLTVSNLSHVELNVFNASDQSNAIISGAGSAQVYDGTSVLISVSPDAGYVIQSLMVDGEDVTSQIVEDETYTFTMPTHNVTISATAVEYVAPTSSDYVRITSLDQLTDGSKVIIASRHNSTATSYYAMHSVFIFPGKPTGVQFTSIISNSDEMLPTTIADDEDNYYWTVNVINDNEYMFTNSENKIIACLSGETNFYQSTSYDYEWTIQRSTASSQSNQAMVPGYTGFVITNRDVTNRAFAFNGEKFGDYNTTNMNTSGYNFFLDFFVQSDEITETFELPITADQWYLISSPVGSVNPTAVGNLTTGTYGLYSFDQTGGDDGKEWRNYKAGAFNQLPLQAGTGYLYINQEGCTLTFTGTPYTGTGTFPLVYSTSTNITKNFRGLNLIGNPYNETVYLEDGREFYVMSGNALVAAERSNINPMEGVFVFAANANDNSITFTTEEPNGSKGVVLNLSQNRGAIVDRAIVRFGEGRQLSKVQLFDNSTKLYIPQNGKDYAIVSTEAQGELPVNFSASENGTYTLGMDVKNMDVNYLHLIDNMTGMDVDLLQTPSYTFEATTTDYESRFRLVFASNNANTDSDNFAFFSNGNLIINNEGNATLQVIDLNGRILSSESVNGSVSTTLNATPGVYMLRLINGENVKVQKIVVR